MKKIILALSLLNGISAFAQLPDTEIFLADIELKNNLVKVRKTVNINNRKGYDNQPFFMPDGKSIIYSAEIDGDGKIHICQYDIKSKKKKKLTQTQTSEYSPGITPDGQYISSVVVEADSAQRVWAFDKIKPEIKHCVTENTDSIGYYAWFGKDTLLYYKLTDPHSLRVLDLKTGEDNWLCNHPTRSFKKVSATTFFYVIHEERQNFMYLYDIYTKKATLYAKDRPDNQDYVWQADLGLVKSEQSKIYHYSKDSKVWAEVVDFSFWGIKKITRFAFSEDKKHMAVVSSLD